MEYREFRAEVTSAEGNHLSGILAPFSSETVIGRLDRGGWREEIAPGAFAKALQEGDTVLLCDHDMSKPLARMSAGTLRLEERDGALHFDADIVDTSYARDVLANVRAKNKKGMSIGFEPVKDEWRDAAGRPATRRTGTHRILREVKLPEGSVVTNPAYKDTSVYARDDSAALLEERERAANAPEVTVTGTDYTDMAAQLIRAYNDLPEELQRAVVVIAEERASSIDAATRRLYAKKGWALEDGSYPIPDVAHLHAAAILAASGHGDVPAAKALIRKRAKELGVDVTSLPGFGKESKAEDAEPEPRDDPDGKEYAAMAAAIKQLHGVDGADEAIRTLRAQLPRGYEQEPEPSTPDEEKGNRALIDIAEIRRRESSRALSL